ncbi:unnamed protein product [Musa acuminata subsp. malaccensis]|uniref:(wild Malaysian banana) hypothetical protein n=1 Tax=Musa acuminata subsp. malaccensis TaxID=214687 RepID=A0A804HN05_MUSAM|nr:unnamed protein product [Musa acuminata subsp. malaccensis]
MSNACLRSLLRKYDYDMYGSGGWSTLNLLLSPFTYCSIS